LKKARDAAQAVVDEITRLDTEDPVPSRILQRQPKSLQAQGDVDDLSDAIDDEEAATKVVTVDEGDIAELQDLAQKLDQAIVRGRSEREDWQPSPPYSTVSPRSAGCWGPSCHEEILTWRSTPTTA